MTIKKAQITEDVNYYLIPVTVFEMNDMGAHQFNLILDKVKDYNPIIRTKSGGISLKLGQIILPAYDMRYTGSCAELTIIDETGMYRIQFRIGQKSEDKKLLSGHQAFNKFKKILLESGIDLDEYAIDNGPEVKKEILKPMIKMESACFVDDIFENVHHIDFHNSYPAGLVNTHPEFKEVITTLYEKRKTNEVYKAILNYSIGYMQSEKCCGARWAHLSRDAINDNYNRINELAERLKANGRVILSYNTDGIWYSGEIYHGAGEGSNLGEWQNDHINCKFRAKSSGSYEFIENGKYHPVVRGRTNLDNIKPRSAWEWGDIYDKDAEPLIYTLMSGGIYKDGKKC